MCYVNIYYMHLSKFIQNISTKIPKVEKTFLLLLFLILTQNVDKNRTGSVLS